MATESTRTTTLAAAWICQENECIHKTKLVQYLKLSTPIVLPKESGPWLMISICNLLLLRGDLLLTDKTSVSDKELLSLFEEHLSKVVSDKGAIDSIFSLLRKLLALETENLAAAAATLGVCGVTSSNAADLAKVDGDEATTDSTPDLGQLIKNFLRNNATQLTNCGLPIFIHEEELKELELCVFFSNNHFSTMCKYNGELYRLVTDLAYINQGELVWENLKEVNGDTLFMAGDFKKSIMLQELMDAKKKEKNKGVMHSAQEEDIEEGGDAKRVEGEAILEPELIGKLKEVFEKHARKVEISEKEATSDEIQLFEGRIPYLELEWVLEKLFSEQLQSKDEAPISGILKTELGGLQREFLQDLQQILFVHQPQLQLQRVEFEDRVTQLFADKLQKRDSAIQLFGAMVEFSLQRQDDDQSGGG